MKQKTALQELISWIEDNTEKNKQTEPIWNKANELLPLEKEQIMEAMLAHEPLVGFNAEHYYNETYENND